MYRFWDDDEKERLLREYAEQEEEQEIELQKYKDAHDGKSPSDILPELFFWVISKGALLFWFILVLVCTIVWKLSGRIYTKLMESRRNPMQ